MAEPWAGGSFGDRGALPARAEPRDDDARRHQHLGAARARRRAVAWSSTPARSRTGTSTWSTSRPGTSGWSCSPTTTSTTPRSPRSSRRRKGCAVRALDPAYCLGADPLVDGEVIDVDGLQLRGGRHPGPHRGLDLAPAAGRAGAADRRHGARPRHHGRRVPGRPARRLLRLDRADARPRRRRRGRHPLAGARPGARRRPRRRSTTTSPTAASGSARSRPPSPSWAIAVPDADDEELPRQVVEIVYPDVDESLWGAAEWSVRAQLAYLAAR